MHFFGIWPWIFATAKPWLQVQNLWERVISSRSSMIIPSLGSPSVRRSPQPKFLNFTMFHHFLNTSGTRGISGSWLFSFFFHETLCRDDTWWHALKCPPGGAKMLYTSELVLQGGAVTPELVSPCNHWFMLSQGKCRLRGLNILHMRELTSDCKAVTATAHVAPCTTDLLVKMATHCLCHDSLAHSSADVELQSCRQHSPTSSPSPDVTTEPFDMMAANALWRQRVVHSCHRSVRLHQEIPRDLESSRNDPK